MLAIASSKKGELKLIVRNETDKGVHAVKILK